MSRLEKAKRVVLEYYSSAKHGLFFNRDNVGDSHQTVYHEDGIQIDVCYGWEYIEVFGLTPAEEDELLDYYSTLGGMA